MSTEPKTPSIPQDARSVRPPTASAKAWLRQQETAGNQIPRGTAGQAKPWLQRRATQHTGAPHPPHLPHTLPIVPPRTVQRDTARRELPTPLEPPVRDALDVVLPSTLEQVGVREPQKRRNLLARPWIPLIAILVVLSIGLGLLALPLRAVTTSHARPSAAAITTAFPQAHAAPASAEAAAQTERPPQEEIPASVAPPVAPPSTPLAAPTSQQTPEELLRQVAIAETGLRSGLFVAMIDYGDGSRSQVQVRFDLGNGTEPRRLHLIASQASDGAQKFEQLTIGEQVWARQADGSWVRATTQDGMWDQWLTYLPHASTIKSATIGQSGDTIVLHYHDDGLNAQTMLSIDTTSGRPLQLRLEIASTSQVITVDYRGWNVPVTIEQPGG